ncbi:GSCOCG00001695001-RA-CDS [Cotesia congregata]|nr:GSCOCG00001695001-RA-CDS [Cotesia congregata]
MPYLRKKPFQRLHVSSDYKDDDEVFHCEVTNEVFKDYNEYCERIILCNSTIWSCSITGKTNMTYEEALHCEENAKKSLKEFPMELRTPILYLASKTHRTSFSEMTDDVYQYARDRYFVGEMVEANLVNDIWCDCHILQVIEPTEAQLKEYAKESPQEKQYYPPAKLFRYEVEQMDGDINQIAILEASQVRRKKLLYSKERNKIFLRMLCEQNSKGVWIVKDSIQQKYSIPKVRFDTIFSGPLPDFNLPKKPIVKQKQVTLDKFFTSDVSKHRAFEKPDPLNKISSGGSIQVKKHRKPRANGKFKSEASVKEEKEKRKEQRNEIRERKREEKQKLAVFAAYVREWNKPREDLECEDLRPIIEATPVDCAIPNKHFGDFAMILEFLQFFYDELEVNTYFPGGLTIDTLEKALLVKEVSGPWSDLIQFLLANIFKYQAQEEDEIHESNSKNDNINFDHGVSSMAEAVKLATRASTWCQTHHGCQLSELTLDHVTLSEILRQHLLSSGGRIGEAASKWRYSERGGYTNYDDPALLLRINQPRLLRLLGHRSVCEFDLEDRLCVATCLINQLLTFAAIRDIIDERNEKVHQARRELKSLIVAEQKKEKEEKERIKEREKDNKVEGDKTLDDKTDDKPKKTRGSREEEKLREKYEQQLSKLKLASKDDQMMLYLGSDRAHRRYWRLLSIPGLFVENDDRTPGSCLTDGTPYLPELQDKDSANKYLKNKFEDEVSDKENNINEAKTSQCPVHCKRPETKWKFYGSSEDIEQVMNNLSIRGLREGELRHNISQELESLKTAINNCPKHKLNPKLFPQTSQEVSNSRTSKKVKNENTNLNYPPDVPIDEVMELSLRDFILEVEDKIKVGCLGGVKVKDRDAWRNAITNCQYDKQCDKLVYGQHEIEADVPINSTLDKIKSETRQGSSRPGTPDSEVGSGIGKAYQDPGKYLGPPDENELVADSKQQMRIRQMACAILQLSQAVEHKYLKKPLGHDDKDKKHLGEEGKERWEHSLMMSTSWSQLFIHINTLESSIAWSRSALNARCRICRKCRDAENMLLCDGCNKGHHLYCLKPKLTCVPEGDWFCVTCKPPDTKSKPKNKTRRKFDEEDEEEALTKDTRHARSRRVLSSEDEAEDEAAPGEETVEEKPKFRELCAICNNSGSVIACDTCVKLYHIGCLDPPLSRAPRGRWSCYECRNIRKNATRRGRERERDRERSCAAAARFRIHSFAKSLLRTETYNWDDSSASEETDVLPRQTRRATKRAAADQDKTLHELLKEVMHHKESWPFLSPVTVNEVPDYHEFIKHPMDFGTVKKKLEAGLYENNSHLFFSDCLLIFENCQTYNQQNSAVYNYVYRAGMRLAKFFEKRSKEMGFNYDDETCKLPPVKRLKLENGDADHNNETSKLTSLTDNGTEETKVNGDN